MKNRILVAAAILCALCASSPAQQTMGPITVKGTVTADAGVFKGPVTLNADPAAPLQPATKQYVDGATVAKAARLAGTPTTCTGGQVPVGVDSSGNALGCAPVAGSAAGANYSLQFKQPGGSFGGDSFASTDGSGNFLLKSLNGRALTSGIYTYSQAQTAGQVHALGTQSAGAPSNPCLSSHGVFLDSLGGVQECYNGSLGLSPARPSYQASFYGQAPSGTQGNGATSYTLFCGDTEPGWSIGTVSHVTGAFWRASNCVRNALFTSTQGIKELNTTGSVTTGLGDTTFQRNFWQGAAGYTAGSDEGLIGQYNSLSEVPSWYGNADGNATPGASSIMTTNGRNCGAAQLGTGQCYGQGRWLVRQAYLLKTSLVSLTGPASSNVDGTGTVTGGLAPSTAIGYIQSTNISATMSLSRASNGYVTATLISGDISRMKGNYDTYSVSGCANGTFNGGVVAADRSSNTLSWNSGNASAASCPSATVTLTSVPQTTNLAVLGVPDTITVGSLTGTTGYFRSSGVACIGGTENESVSYTSSTISGGLQTLVITHRFPHDIGTVISDGACRVFSIDADYIPNGSSHAAWVLTSIPSSTTFTWANSYGGNAIGSSLVTGGTAFVPATAITTVNISRSSGSSTATITGVSGADPGFSAYGPGRNLTISGCSDTSFNGTYAITGGNSYPRTVTYASAASTTSSCTNGSANISGNDGITFWEGARVWNTKDPNAPPSVTGSTDPRQTGWMGLEANEANWTPNEPLEQMTNPNMVYTLHHDLCGKTTQDGAATASSCTSSDIRGSIRRWNNISLFEPLTSYYGFGGSFAAPDLIFAAPTGVGAGVYNSLFNALKAPVTGLLEVGPCLNGGTCKYDIFNGYNAGRITTDTSTNTIEIIANNIKLTGTVAFGNPISAAYLTAGNSGYGGSLRIARDGNGSGVSMGFAMCSNQYSTDYALCVNPSSGGSTLTTYNSYVPASSYSHGNSLTADYMRANTFTGYVIQAESSGVTGFLSGAYTGAACPSGCDNYSYFPVAFVNGVPSRYNDGVYGFIKVDISNAQPLSASNYVTLTCTNLAAPYPSGATVHILRRNYYGAHGFYDVGDCTGTKTLVDDGSATTNLGQYGIYNNDLNMANGVFKGAIFGSYSTLGFWSDFSNLSTIDTALSRLSAGSMALGNGVKGDTSGALSLNRILLTSTAAPTAVAGAVYYDATNGRIGSCSPTVCSPLALKSEIGSGGGSSTPVVNPVAYSATPTFSATADVNRLVLTGNVTSSTIANGVDGARMTMNIQPGTYAFVFPTNMTAATLTPSKINVIQYYYSAADSKWLQINAAQ